MTRYGKIFIAVALLCLPVVSVQAADPAPAQTPAPIKYLPRDTVTIQTNAGQDYVFDVEMATKDKDQEHGLMDRTELSNDSGMLFLFNDEEKRTFWMKDTLIPLDMLFIGRDGVINHIHHNAKPQDETMISSGMPAFAVLEVNGGLADALGIKEGDKILHPAFRNVTH